MTIYESFHPIVSRGPDVFHHPDDLPKQPLRFPPWLQSDGLAQGVAPHPVGSVQPSAASPAAKSPGAEVAPVASIFAPSHAVMGGRRYSQRALSGPMALTKQPSQGSGKWVNPPVLFR